MFEEGNQITVEEVDRVLSEIESKYSPVECGPIHDSFEENLAVLSKEFDSVGVEPIDLKKPISKVFKQVVSSSRSLVQIHRRTLSQMRDVNITVQTKNSNSNYLRKVVDDCNTKINMYEDKTGILQNKISVLEDKVTEHKKKETDMKNEIEKIKIYCNMKNGEYSRHIRQVSEENKRLKESLGTDINTTHSKDEVLLKIIAKYKANEEIYKETIHKLQENNRQLLEEVIDLKSKRKS